MQTHISRTTTLPVARPRVPLRHGRQRLSIVVARSSSSDAAGKDSTGLSSLRFSKPTATEMKGLMEEWCRLGRYF